MRFSSCADTRKGKQVDPASLLTSTEIVIREHIPLAYPVFLVFLGIMFRIFARGRTRLQRILHHEKEFTWSIDLVVIVDDLDVSRTIENDPCPFVKVLVNLTIELENPAMGIFSDMDVAAFVGGHAKIVVGAHVLLL
jgi:hypothetical protein